MRASKRLSAGANLGDDETIEPLSTGRAIWGGFVAVSIPVSSLVFFHMMILVFNARFSQISSVASSISHEVQQVVYCALGLHERTSKPSAMVRGPGRTNSPGSVSI